MRLATSYQHFIVDVAVCVDILKVLRLRRISVQRRRWPKKRPVKSKKKL
jgi:hypothetical protein